jgi:hypothetical protein
MVHALEKVHEWLERDGVLVSIQPKAKAAIIEYHTNEGISRVGAIKHRLDFINQVKSLEAVTQVIESGLFSKENETTFDFLTHAPSIEFLQDYLAENSVNSYIDEETMRRAKELSATNDPVVRREEVLITRLRPLF